MRQYIGHLATGDPLHAYLCDAILPLVAPRPERHPDWRVFRVSATSDVYLYEDKWSGAKVVGKFYARTRGLNGSGAPQSAEHECRALDYLRAIGFNASPDYVVRPLGVRQDLGDLLVVEHLAGEQLDDVIEAAIRQGQTERLYRKLTDLARFFARLHNSTAGGPGVNFGRTRAYFDRVTAYLAQKGGVSRRRIERLRDLAKAHAARPAMWQDWQVVVHGDATPSNFLFGREREVMVIDLERMHRDDRVYDVGRLCGELKHWFLRATGDPLRSEPFIGHFLWEYAGHFPDRRRAFAAVTGRLPFHLGLTLLRIARNPWIDEGYRARLVREATTILEGAL
jgi:aminoglycoside phosphotransferase (APT) family kinase protein